MFQCLTYSKPSLFIVFTTTGIHDCISVVKDLLRLFKIDSMLDAVCI